VSRERRVVYRHRQFGWVIAIGTAIALVFATALIASLSARTLDTAGWMVYALYAVIAGAFVLFGWLDVVVDDHAIDVRFGAGLVRRRIDLAKVVRCDPIRTRVWWGWGLHWTPSGWLYNVSGRDAVRLEMNGERAVMIGSDDARALALAIETARKERLERT
jgi:hypothetical protein